MRIKVLTADAEGNIFIKKEELQKLLDAAYDRGYDDGYNKNKNYIYWDYTPRPQWWYTTSTATKDYNPNVVTTSSTIYYNMDDDEQMYINMEE